MINPERYRQIDELFQAALEVEPAKRSEFISSACGGDQSLQEEVEALIASSGREWSLIDDPVPEMATLILPEQRPDLPVGESLGHYEILSLLGAGGMGQVYLAEDSRLGRKVALKLLPLEFTKNEPRLRRFQQEARAASALNHPGILTIHDIAEIEGRHLIATEFIDGETLRQRLKRAPLTLPETLEIAIQIASAISAAHQAGIVHRDVKPENIMLRRDGYVKVLDFGLAKLTHHHEPALDVGIADRLDASSGVIMGTVKYMSPEQAQGLPVDQRSDIFSLGVVLYEMVAGFAPFNGESAKELIKSIVDDRPPVLPEHLPDLSQDLQNIITKALAKDRSRRYQTAEELLVALTAIRHRRESGTGPHTTVQRTNSREISTAKYLVGGIKRHKMRVAAAFVIFLVVTTSAGYAVYRFLGRNFRSSLQNVRLTRLTATGKAFNAAISPNGKYVAFVTSEANKPDPGQETLWVREVATNTNAQISPPGAHHYSKLTFSHDGNDLYYMDSDKDYPQPALYQVPVAGDGAPKRVLAGVINPLSGGPISISPDGNRLVFVREYPDNETAIVTANADGSDERKIASRQGDASFAKAVWSPDGEKIAFAGAQQDTKGSYYELIEIDAQGGSEKPISPQRWFWIDDLVWLSDGSGLLIAADNGEGSSQQIWEISYPAGESRTLTTDFVTYSGLSLSKDSSVLVTTRNGTIQNIWTQPADDSGAAKQITNGDAGDGWDGIAWTPDGRIVYSSSANGHQDIWIMDADGSNQKQLTVNLGSNGLGLSVSFDGHYIAFVSDQSGHGNIWRINSDGSGPKQLTNGAGETNPVFLPDGWIGFPCWIDGNQARCKVSLDGGEPVQVTGPYSDMMRFSPDGRLIAFIPADGQKNKRIGVVPVDESEPPRIFDLPPDSMPKRMQWSADSRALTYIDARRTSNIWYLPIDGGKAVKLTNFKDRSIFSFAWSRDGKQLAMARAMTTRDVVLMKNFR
jgi:eukaryotic-like serine/threonine-protein kinase